MDSSPKFDITGYFWYNTNPGDELNRQELYFKNCKPTMSKSRKNCSKIHAKSNFSGVKRFFADRIPNVNSGFGYALAA